MMEGGLAAADAGRMTARSAITGAGVGGLRIIDAVAHRLELPHEKVMINIEHYGNTSAGTLPLCLWDFEDKLKKGDNLIFTAFGAGFTWGAVYVKWGYDGKKQ